MNKFSVTLLIFAWSIPFLFFFGIISLFCDNKFSGAWILSPIEYPLSHSIFVFVALSCAAILNWALGNIKNYNKLLFILLGIFGGLIINISSIVFGLAKLGHSIITIFSLVFLIFYPIIKLEWSQIKLILMGLLFICLARLFLLLNQKVDNKKLSFYLAVLIVSSPCLPMVIPPIVGSLIGNKLSSANRESFSPRKKFLLAIIKLIIITFCFIWIAKSYHTPGLIISSGLRHIWGLTTFNHPYKAYEEAIKNLSDCQLIKEEIGRIKSFAIAEGKNYIISDLAPAGDASHLHIQLIGENKQAIVKGCFGSKGEGCAFRHYGLKKENENKAQIISETEIKTIEILECL